ncbi:MAG: glycoside hydrolase family 2 TIM barrel-domain containing protein [Bacteroidota bacterium]
MNNFIKITAINIMAILMFACNGTTENTAENTSEGPSKVEVRNIDGRYRLFVNGEEFYVKGAGCQNGPCYQVASHGGNAIRTWSTGDGRLSGREMLDNAWENGLMVLMGIYVGSERHGFDYNDEGAVAQQLERIRKEVLELKDHPALLGWGIGNELNLNYTNKKVWNAVNDIAAMIKEVDGNHVVTTMLAGIAREEVEYIAEHSPNIDFLSIQLYGSIEILEQRLQRAGYDGPYLITEWGATGHWEAEETSWGSPIQQTSTEKAESIKTRYENVILADEENCMGSFIFLWGQKQERTPTWYGLYTENGEKTEAVGMMQYLWTGSWPENRAPHLHEITIEGKGGRFDNVKLTREEEYTTLIDVEHKNPDNLSVRAEIMPEPKEVSVGGDYEPRPTSIDGLIISANISEIQFKAPRDPGPYRILVYVTDQYNNAATANIPFLVE